MCDHKTRTNVKLSSLITMYEVITVDIIQLYDAVLIIHKDELFWWDIDLVWHGQIIIRSYWVIVLSPSLDHKPVIQCPHLNWPLDKFRPEADQPCMCGYIGLQGQITALSDLSAQPLRRDPFIIGSVILHNHLCQPIGLIRVGSVFTNHHLSHSFNFNHPEV